jgi:hypothetical protein
MEFFFQLAIFQVKSMILMTIFFSIAFNRFGFQVDPPFFLWISSWSLQLHGFQLDSFIQHFPSWSHYFCLSGFQVINPFTYMNYKLILLSNISQIDLVIFVYVNSKLIPSFTWNPSWSFYLTYFKLILSFSFTWILRWSLYLYGSNLIISFFILRIPS